MKAQEARILNETQNGGEGERPKSVAEKAFGRILKEGLTPSPEIYRVWHIYYSASNPEIVHAVDIMVKSGKKITDEACNRIYDRFLSDEKTGLLIHRAGDIVGKTIKNVTGIVNSAQKATSSYNVALTGFQGQLHDNMSVEQVHAIMAPILAETQSMIDENKRLEAKLAHSSQTMEKLQQELNIVREEALTDSLTGVANRKSFDIAIKRLIEDARTENKTFSVIMLDIDHFKDFNDNFGHQMGDQVLRLVAKTLLDGIKGRDLVARYGGEEFMILLPETNIVGGENVGNELRRCVENRELVNKATGGKISHITISGGVTEYRYGESIEDVVKRVDNALYMAKNNGRNQIVSVPVTGGH